MGPLTANFVFFVPFVVQEKGQKPVAHFIGQ